METEELLRQLHQKQKEWIRLRQPPAKTDSATRFIAKRGISLDGALTLLEMTLREYDESQTNRGRGLAILGIKRYVQLVDSVALPGQRALLNEPKNQETVRRSRDILARESDLVDMLLRY